MNDQKPSRSFNRLAWLLAPIVLAALLVAGGASIIRAHAAPALSGTYNFQASVNAVPGLSTGLSITGQLQLQVSGQSVQGQLCQVTVTLNSSPLNSSLLSSSLLNSSLLNSGANTCLTVTGSVSGADAIAMTILNLLPGQNLLLSGLPNASLGTQGGLSGSLSLNLGLVQASGSWSATLVSSASN